MTFKKAAIIYTPKIGKRKEFKNTSQLLALIKKISVESPVFFETKSIEDTYSFISESLAKKEFDVILVAGGDGLISTVCNALMAADKNLRVPFLPLPMGSGNTFAADLNINTIKQAFDLVEKSQSASKIDLLKVTTQEKTFYCVNVLGAGFITDSTIIAEKSGKKLGAFSYILAVFKALRFMRNYNIKLSDRNGNTIFQSSRSVLLSFNNNSKTGAAFKMAPNALVNDGLTDIIILHDISRRELLAGFLKIFNGEHIYCRGCEYFQTDYAKVETSPNMALMPDGEIFGSSPFELEVISGELEVAVQLVI